MYALLDYVLSFFFIGYRLLWCFILFLTMLSWILWLATTLERFFLTFVDGVIGAVIFAECFCFFLDDEVHHIILIFSLLMNYSWLVYDNVSLLI